MSDAVNHPAHYNWFSNGAEIIDITENLTFNAGNVVKYVARAGRKTEDPLEDLRKAKFYLEREIHRLIQSKDDTDLEELDAEYPALPYGLWYSEFQVWEDSEGDEWRWDGGTWYYRTPGETGWVSIQGTPYEAYGPFKVKDKYV